MTENMKKFLKLVSRNEELAKKLSSMDKEGIIAAAGELGVELAEADFAQVNELDDDELDAVAGGKDCYCAIGGGGEKSENKWGRDKICACVLAGGGHGYEYAYATDLVTHETEKLSEEVARCFCNLGGYGSSCI